MWHEKCAVWGSRNPKAVRSTEFLLYNYIAEIRRDCASPGAEKRFGVPAGHTQHHPINPFRSPRAVHNEGMTSTMRNDVTDCVVHWREAVALPAAPLARDAYDVKCARGVGHGACRRVGV